MSIQFGNIKVLFLALVLSILIYGGRFLLSRILISKNTSISEAAMISFIIPKGLAAAVLAEVPMHMDLPVELESIFIEIRAVVYMVILFSILFTAFLIYSQETGLTNSWFSKYFSGFGKPTAGSQSSDGKPIEPTRLDF